MRPILAINILNKRYVTILELIILDFLVSLLFFGQSLYFFVMQRIKSRSHVAFASYSQDSCQMKFPLFMLKCQFQVSVVIGYSNSPQMVYVIVISKCKC